MKKKAVSPLIATVLLITFAVALGAFIMNWGQIFTRDQISDAELRSTRELECSLDIGLDIYKIDGDPVLYYSESDEELTFMIRNTGNKDIDSIRVVIIGQNRTDIQVIDVESSGIMAGSVLRSSVEYPNNNIDQVEFIPYMNTTGTSVPTLCTGNSIIRYQIQTK